MKSLTAKPSQADPKLSLCSQQNKCGLQCFSMRRTHLCEWMRGVAGGRATGSKTLPDGGDTVGQTFCSIRVCRRGRNALVRELFGGGSLSLEVHSFPSLQPGAAEPNQSRHSCRAEPERQAATPPPNITRRCIARPVRLVRTQTCDIRVCLQGSPSP